MDFVLKITLGTNAMHTCEDVGDALVKVGSELIRFGGQDKLLASSSAEKIRDNTGKIVGTYQVVPKTYP
jgi:hypothetical protein